MSEGLGQKYVVTRIDGRDTPGEKHDGCQYFVLDLTHDIAAREAAMQYAWRIRLDNPQLSDEIKNLVRDILDEMS